MSDAGSCNCPLSALLSFLAVLSLLALLVQKYKFWLILLAVLVQKYKFWRISAHSGPLSVKEARQVANACKYKSTNIGAYTGTNVQILTHSAEPRCCGHVSPNIDVFTRINVYILTHLVALRCSGHRWEDGRVWQYATDQTFTILTKPLCY